MLLLLVSNNFESCYYHGPNQYVHVSLVCQMYFLVLVRHVHVSCVNNSLFSINMSFQTPYTPYPIQGTINYQVQQQPLFNPIPLQTLQQQQYPIQQQQLPLDATQYNIGFSSPFTLQGFPSQSLPSIQEQIVQQQPTQTGAMTNMLPGSQLSEQDAKRCRCILQVGAKQPEWCLANKAWYQKRTNALTGQTETCYNPYAVCAANLGQQPFTCTENYDFESLTDSELIAFAYLHSNEGFPIIVPRPYNRLQMLQNIARQYVCIKPEIPPLQVNFCGKYGGMGMQ
jgi:hypothetical protein